MMESAVEIRVMQQEEKLHDRPAPKGMSVAFSAYRSEKGKESEVFDMKKDSLLSTFMSNYECWNASNNLSSVSNTDNCYFREIVNMGLSAVPYIYNELQKGPTDLVYALDEIFGYPIKYEGFVPLEQSCNIWLSILQKTEKF